MPKRIGGDSHKSKRLIEAYLIRGTFTRREPILDADGEPIMDDNGKPETEAIMYEAGETIPDYPEDGLVPNHIMAKSEYDKYKKLGMDLPPPTHGSTDTKERRKAAGLKADLRRVDTPGGSTQGPIGPGPEGTGGYDGAPGPIRPAPEK